MGDIEDRLRSHAQAFDGLLSLIPAKYYYGEDTSDQWRRKKQTKEQAREAKRAKLDPDSAKTAKDIMDENARKRKRENENEGGSEKEELGSELPKEGLNRGDSKQKKQKPTGGQGKLKNKAEKSNESTDTARQEEERNTQKKIARKEKKMIKEAARKERIRAERSRVEESAKSEKEPGNKNYDERQPSTVEDNQSDGTEKEILLKFDAEQESPLSVPSTPDSPGFDGTSGQSASSSISSIAPPAASIHTFGKPSQANPPKPTPDELKERLQRRLDELRAARHADGLNGKPARNRQELIEARRQKAEQRKMHKKLLRQKAKEEEQRARDEAIARRFSPGGSGSLLASPRSPADSIGPGNSFSFGRVAFSDGTYADATLSNLCDKPTRHGPQDPATALKAAENKKARLAGMDAEKRAEIEEKDTWLNAKKRARGEQVRDDTSLLKKALKRKESAKRKSEREWKDRLETIRKDKESRQARREENLRKRRDEKGNRGKKGVTKKKKARPGFEGSFKARVGGGK